MRRLVLAGKGELACKVLEYIRHALALWQLDWAILGIPTRSDPGVDRWEPSFSARCRLLGVPTVAEVAAADLKPGDLLLSLQYDKIIRMADLGGANAFNVHFSALPRHRGCYPGMWAIRSGDEQAGVSLHVLTAGIDDGPVVDQTLFPLHDEMTARELYDYMHLCGAALVRSNLPDLLLGHTHARPQDVSQGTYHDRHSINFADLEIPVESLDAVSCSRYARSLVFPPFQFPALLGQPVVACATVPDISLAGESAPTPFVQALSPQEKIVRCRGGWLRVSFLDT